MKITYFFDTTVSIFCAYIFIYSFSFFINSKMFLKQNLLLRFCIQNTKIKSKILLKNFLSKLLYRLCKLSGNLNLCFIDRILPIWNCGISCCTLCGLLLCLLQGSSNVLRFSAWIPLQLNTNFCKITFLQKDYPDEIFKILIYTSTSSYVTKCARFTYSLS